MQDNDNIQEIIKTRLAELPPDLQKAITAADLPMKFDAISKKFNLRIDQSGYLQTETLLVMLGLEKASDFTSNLAANAEIEQALAKSIADEVGLQIFTSIRSLLQEMESAPTQETAPKIPDTSMDKAHILNSIETADTYSHLPVNVLATMATPGPSPVSTPPQPAAPAPLVDRLMAAPAATSNEKVEKRAPGPDPYREPIQ